MILRVMYSDGKFDMVNQPTLDGLLASERLAGFLRASGWAFVGRDPIRAAHAPSYQGDDRRRA